MQGLCRSWHEWPSPLGAFKLVLMLVWRCCPVIVMSKCQAAAGFLYQCAGFICATTGLSMLELEYSAAGKREAVGVPHLPSHLLSPPHCCNFSNCVYDRWDDWSTRTENCLCWFGHGETWTWKCISDQPQLRSASRQCACLHSWRGEHQIMVGMVQHRSHLKCWTIPLIKL